MTGKKLGQYDDFICIASKCPATCCSGWGVEIDEESLEKYSEILHAGVDFSEGCFEQKKNGDCFFLNKNGLCDLYTEHGKDSLCYTCDTYPRHIEEFPGIREYSLSVSCPVVAEALIDLKSEFEKISELPEDGEHDTLDYEDFNEELYELLLKIRETIFGVLKSEDESFWEKAGMVEAFTKKLQAEMDSGASQEDLSALCKLENFQKAIYSQFETNPLLLFDIFAEMEPLQDEFSVFVKKTGRWIEAEEIAPDFLKSEFLKNHPDTEKYLERIVFYFIFTYLCGAVYDDYVHAMAEVSVFCAYMIFWLWIGREHDKGDILSLEEMVEIIFRFSREIEHSNKNMILLEQLLDEL